MADHPNIQLIHDGYALFEKGDIEGFLELLDDGIVWNIPGRNALSGAYSGKDGLVEFFTKLGTLFPETAIEVEDVLANDRRAVALVKISNSKAGKTLSMHYAHIFALRGGKIAEFWELPEDQYAEDAFYSA
jgi:ketosteroid isomerase-like protein